MEATRTSRTASELRRHRRQTLHYPAWIVLDPGQPPYRCMLSDVSKMGAKITIAGHLELPPQFTLLLSEDGRTRRTCRVAWREGTVMGVEYLRVGDESEQSS